MTNHQKMIACWDLEELILQLVDEAQSMTHSDLQGRVSAEARKIIDKLEETIC